MNEAHLHMVVNHFPIIGTILGLGILVAGFIFKNNTIKNTAYSLFVVGAIFSAVSMATGDGAERMVEDMPSVGHHIIHEHEEIAEKLALIMYILGIASIIGFYMNVKKNAKAKILSFIILALSIGATIIAVNVGTSGGEVRHTEIREGASKSQPDNDKKIEDHEEHENH